MKNGNTAVGQLDNEHIFFSKPATQFTMSKFLVIFALLCLISLAFAGCPCTAYTGADAESKAQADCDKANDSSCAVRDCEETDKHETGKTCCNVSTRQLVSRFTPKENKEEVVRTAMQTSSRGLCRRYICRTRCICSRYRCYCYRYCYYYYYYC